ncbi:hypothetical protein [Microbacterium oxydans]|jgi:hypothetical protein|uniref:hypothetical protein n=1 Tax=Microbacterium oxydans TaxID=82380 RepID=UPI00226B7AF9|nr:hypothetical protein [Microbacterium oxydans]WAA66101.1 hypothetical protein MME74_18010 [Microbacterium oxydans]
MEASDDLFVQARATVGFFRVLLDDEHEIAYSAGYLSDTAVTAGSSTRSEDHTFSAVAWPAALAPAPGPRLHHENDVDAYLDGAFLERSSWRRTEDAWVTWLRVADDVRLEVSLVGRVAGPPAELSIARDTPSL